MKAYYIARSDGDWDLLAVVAGEDDTDPRLVRVIEAEIEFHLRMQHEETRILEDAEPGDFPQVLVAE